MCHPAGDEKRKRKRKLRVVRPSPESFGKRFGTKKTENASNEENETSPLSEKDNKKLLELQAGWIKKLTTKGEMTSFDFSLEGTSSPGSDVSLQNSVQKGSHSKKQSETLVELLPRDDSVKDEIPDEIRSRYERMVSEIHCFLDSHNDDLKRMFEHHIKKILMEIHDEFRTTIEEKESDD